jgi:hypothetical protein
MAVHISPSTSRFIHADIFTMASWISGKIIVSSSGAFGLLNDSTHSLLESHDSRTMGILDRHGPSDHSEIVHVPKDSLNAIAFPRRKDLGPMALVRGGYSTVTEYPVRIMLSWFQVEGILERPGQLDLAELMTVGSREFLPLYCATLTSTLHSDLLLEAGGMLIHRRHVDFVAVLPQRIPSQVG